MNGNAASDNGSDGCLGILMLETRFPRLIGDIGNPQTWPFPVLYEVVRGASPDRIVQQRGEGMLEPFIQAGRRLVARGADGISTSCGFLSLFQQDLAANIAVPVAASSLLQIPMIERLLPAGKRVGVITMSAAALTEAHLACAGADIATPVAGIDPESDFARAILGDEEDFDAAAAQRELLKAGRRLLRDHRNIGAVVLECTNLPPYAKALAADLNLPVHDIVSFLTWFQRGFAPNEFRSPG